MKTLQPKCGIEHTTPHVDRQGEGRLLSIALYGPQAALAILLVLPPAALGLAVRRYLVSGFTLGAIRR